MERALYFLGTWHSQCGITLLFIMHHILQDMLAFSQQPRHASPNQKLGPI